MFIITFTYAWEDFLWPLIITSNPDLYTAPLGLALFVTRKPNIVRHADGRARDRDPPDGDRVHDPPAPGHPRDLSERHEGLSSPGPAPSTA